MKESVRHAIALSNFAKGFDKYSRIYDKAAISERRFLDRFFVLRPDEIEIGVEKTRRISGIPSFSKPRATREL